MIRQKPYIDFAPDPIAGEVMQVGDRVVKNPKTWTPSEFDRWGRGEGVGEIVQPPFDLDDDWVDVRWPAGRCFEHKSGLLPAMNAPSPLTPGS